ncbi:MAG TPA: MerR family transcriptional regulator [Nevskiaceae bacterium]|nr:MerR family transcriptional regulator [Nevskiaceae bacterium]
MANRNRAATRTPPEDQYRIAAVARMTGVPETTIRMWERRYRVVEPARSSGNGRLYSRAEVERLQLVKAVVDAGHAIGTVAALDAAQLRQRLAEAGVQPRPGAEDRASRVAVFGANLATQLRHAWSGREDLELAHALDAVPEDGSVPDGADVLIVEVPTLPAVVLRRLRELRGRTSASLLVVVYGFASRQALSRLDQDGIIALALPADPAHLARLCHLARALPAEVATAPERRLLQRAAPRRYDDAFLATTARRSSSVRCECPNHLADLLVKLNAFEQYSLECEQANPADASVHALLYSAAAQCREMLELALAKVIEHEGLQAAR